MTLSAATDPTENSFAGHFCSCPVASGCPAGNCHTSLRKLASGTEPQGRIVCRQRAGEL